MQMRLIIICIMSINKQRNNIKRNHLSNEFINNLSEVRKISAGVISSDALLLGARELIIHHAGEKYMLRVTNQGKLILTK